jgi:regulator of replication initiation timing
MGVLGDLLGQLERLINEHGSATILKERIGLVNDKLAMLKEHIEKLEKENARLVKEGTDLKQQLTRQQKSEEFVESGGAAFKRLSGGGYSKTPYCPYCHRTMSCLELSMPYACSYKSCEHVADFNGAMLEDIMRELPK